MRARLSERQKRLAVGLLLASQLTLFWLSFDEIMEISIFCTASKSEALRWAFGWLHVGYVAVFMLGVIAIFLPRARVPYALILLPLLAALPVQAELVDQGSLYCDAF